MKKLAVGCGILVAVGLLGAAIVALLLPMFSQWVQGQIAQEEERRQLAAGWQPPQPSAGPDKFFLHSVADYQLISTDQKAAIADLEIDSKGRHAVYRSGSSRIDVYAYPMTKSESDALLDRVEQIFQLTELEGGQRFSSRMGDNQHTRCYVQTSRLGQNHLWALKGWLLVFRTRDRQSREPFVLAYLKASDAPPQRDQPAPSTKGKQSDSDIRAGAMTLGSSPRRGAVPAGVLLCGRGGVLRQERALSQTPHQQ